VKVQKGGNIRDFSLFLSQKLTQEARFIWS